MIAAVVPVKELESSKSRLAASLGGDAPARLALAMLDDVLDALMRVPALTRVGVVTPDDHVARAARDGGAVAVMHPEPGLNPAIEHAAEVLAPGPNDGVLVVLGDVAGVRPQEIERLLASVGERGIALAPANDGGTSALLRAPRGVIPAGFGPGSAKVHRDLAEQAGVPYVEVPLPSLAIDLDEREDLDAFLASDAAGERTRALLGELGLEKSR